MHIRRASDPLPIRLRILHRRGAGPKALARSRPARLRDPHLQALLDRRDSRPGLSDSLPESVRAGRDGRALPVRIHVDADKIDGRDDRSVCRIDPAPLTSVSPERGKLSEKGNAGRSPRRPSVHMAHGLPHAHRPHHPPDIVNLLRQPIGVGLLAVQVLAADRDGRDPASAVPLDGVQQCRLLGVEVGFVFGPHADEETRVGGERGGHGARQRAAVVRGEDADVVEGPAGEGLDAAEGVLPVGLGFAGAVGVFGGAGKDGVVSW